MKPAPVTAGGGQDVHDRKLSINGDVEFPVAQ